MKVYISGKISGIDIDLVSILFSRQQMLLEQEGHTVINPLNINHNHDKSWTSYMKEDLKAMIDCDAVFMLSNWKQSRGAIIEHNLAKELDMIIFYEHD